MAEKLHTRLAVLRTRTPQSTQVLKDTHETILKKHQLFVDRIVKETPINLDEHGNPIDGVEREDHPIVRQLTVDKLYQETLDHWAPTIDDQSAVCETNMLARAPLTIDGVLIADAVPATMLLDIESRLNQWLAIVKDTPTFEAARGYTEAPDSGKGVWRAQPQVAFRTKKVPKALVKYEATKDHPAQTMEYSEDQPTAKIVTLEEVGVYSPAQKTALLDRLERARRAVHAAREQANETPVVEKPIAKALFDYLMNGNGKAS